METTTFLAMLWGPVLLALGIGMFTNRAFYTRLYRDLEKESLAVLTLALVATAAGIAQVSVHNVWSTFPEGLISFLGWATLLKGLMLAAFPTFGDRMGVWAVKVKLLSLSSVVMLVLGAYLTWLAFL